MCEIEQETEEIISNLLEETLYSYKLLKEKLVNKNICNVQLKILNEIVKSEKENRVQRNKKVDLGKNIKKIVSQGINDKSIIILKEKTNELKYTKKIINDLSKRRVLLRRLADSLVWNIFGRNVVINSQRVNIDFISDKEGFQYEIEFFKEKLKSSDGIVVPIFNDITNCLSIGDISVVTIKKDLASFDFFEIKKSKTGEYTPRSIRQTQDGEKITNFLEEGKGESITGFKKKFLYHSSVVLKYNWGDIKDLIIKGKKNGYAKRIKEKCIVYLAYDTNKYKFEDIIDKVIPQNITENNDMSGRIGSLETNVRNKMVKPIFLFDIGKNQILDIIFNRVELIVFFNYSKLNKLIENSTIAFCPNDEGELCVYLKTEPEQKLIIEGNNTSEIIHCGLSIKTFIELTEEMVPHFNEMIKGLPKNHPLSPYDSKEKFDFKVVSGKVVNK